MQGPHGARIPLCCAATAPVDRLKMIMQVQDTSKRGLTLKEGMQRMAAEGR